MSWNISIMLNFIVQFLGHCAEELMYRSPRYRKCKIVVIRVLLYESECYYTGLAVKYT